MSFRLEIVDLGLPGLDALDVDAIAVFVGPERPLQGLAGYVDWRLCGALSRAIRGGLFGAERGEALLLPSAGRLSPELIFCFGLGEAPLTSELYAAACNKTCMALARAGSASFATSLPALQANVDGSAVSARLWLDACAGFPGKRIVLLGEIRSLQRDLAAAKHAMGQAAEGVEIVAPQARVEMPHRGPPLPSRPSVIR